MKFILLSVALLGISLGSSSYSLPPKAKRDYYQVIVYHFKTAEQKQRIDNYLETAYVPALHRLGIQAVGGFTPIANDTVADKRVIVILPFSSLDEIANLPSRLSKDETLQNAARSFSEANYNEPPYSRIERIILYAFPKAPSMQLPQLKSPKAEHVYELRSYESPTDYLYQNKVRMFNEGGEVDLFKRLNFNAVFYSEVVAGANMPNLMYMTSFENMADRDAHWKTFSADPEWKKLSTDPFYQHNVSHADIILMKATNYSDY